MKIGIDIQDVERMKRLIGTPRMERIFSARELRYLETKNFAPKTMAGLYAAKEAFFKAMGTGVLLSKLNRVEVLHSETGAPYLVCEELLPEGAEVSISISHTGQVAVAVCVVV